MEILFREMMLTSVSGWIALWIDPKIYLEMFVIGMGTYAAVSLLEYRRIRKIPMDEALKNVECPQKIFYFLRKFYSIF